MGSWSLASVSSSMVKGDDFDQLLLLRSSQQAGRCRKDSMEQMKGRVEGIAKPQVQLLFYSEYTIEGSERREREEGEGKLDVDTDSADHENRAEAGWALAVVSMGGLGWPRTRMPLRRGHREAGG